MINNKLNGLYEKRMSKFVAKIEKIPKIDDKTVNN